MEEKSILSSKLFDPVQSHLTSSTMNLLIKWRWYIYIYINKGDFSIFILSFQYLFYILYVRRELLNKMLFYHFSCKKLFLHILQKCWNIIHCKNFFYKFFFSFDFFLKSIFLWDYHGLMTHVIGLASSPELTRVIVLLSKLFLDLSSQPDCIELLK